MGRVWESLFRPIMDWLDAREIPGGLAPLVFFGLVIGATSFRRIVLRRAEWRDWLAIGAYSVAATIILLGMFGVIEM